VAVQENVATLQRRGVIIIPPAEGELACGEVGPGRLNELPVIMAAVARAVGET